MRKLLAALFVALALAGCSTTQTPDSGAAVEDRAPSASQPGGAGPGAGGVGAGGAADGGAAGGGTTGAVPGMGGPGGAGGPGASSQVGGPGGALAGRAVDPLRDPASPLSKRSIYFDYDSYTVSDEYRPQLEAHAKYLIENRSARMRIEGNTDERGSSEYNIALGQRRADAVRRMLQGLGASESQIETVSFGKEKPRNSAHDEKAWADNRRADIAYQGE